MRMKKLVLLLLSVCFAFSAYAQLNGSGFYRVYNVGDSRYIYVTDNTGSVNTSTASAEMKAIQLIKGLDKAISNPATVLYFKQISGMMYDIQAQGTGVNAIIGYTPTIEYVKRADAYKVSAEVYGMTLSLGSDANDFYKDEEVSFMTTGESGNQILWKVVPIATDGDNYFGVKPTIAVDGKYYQPFYASFAFSLASSGMKAYYVSAARGCGAKLEPINDDVIPAATPVIIECSSSDPSDNRLEVLSTGGTPINNNLLGGVYFNNPLRMKSKDATTKFDANTMRVLGKTSDGKLGFVMSSDKNLAANQAYLKVSAGSDVEIYAMDDAQYASIDMTIMDEADVNGVYSILGVKLREDCSIDELPAGIYIVNGKKIIKR